jgi:hypothetical protein
VSDADFFDLWNDLFSQKKAKHGSRARIEQEDTAIMGTSRSTDFRGIFKRKRYKNSFRSICSDVLLVFAFTIDNKVDLWVRIPPEIPSVY